MLQVVNLSKSYGARTLFENASFSLIPRERLGLVGRNGCGKSTLFKLILGSEYADEGNIKIPRGYRVGHLAQELKFTEPNILQEVCMGLPEDERDQTWRGEILLHGLGFTNEDFEKAPSQFSGGFQIRLNLVKLLLSEPNLLLLDEPTNYLDIVSMRWLTGFLRSWQGELILISHDRLFMDDVCTHTMLIHRGNVRKIQGGTEKLYTQIALDEEIYEKTRLTEDKKREQLEEFVTRFRAKASKAAAVQSKVKLLEKMGKKEELVDEATLDFQFCEAPFPGKIMSEVRDLSFNYPDGPTLIKDLSLVIERQDRIGIIGKNGKGKSTLLRLLCEELKPVEGSVTASPNAKIGYFGQSNIQRLSPNLTVEEEIDSANPSLHRTKVRAICGTVMFSGDDALKKVNVLSGGEKSRVLLGKILAQPTNFLLLDEPTNHLDMESIEALIESVRKYEGALVIVTHSELLLRELCNRLVVFQGEVPYLFPHDYNYFLDKVGWGDESEMSSTDTPKKEKAEKVKAPRGNQQEKERRALEKKIAELEKQIAVYEAERQEIETELAEASQTGNIQFAKSLSLQLKDIQTKLAATLAEWEAASQKLPAA